MKLAPALAAFALGPGPNLSSEALAPRTDPSAGRRPRPRRLLADDLDALPWSDLASRLTGSLVAASAAAYVDECYPPLRDLPRSDRTNHALIDRPSGLCMDHLFCAYERCNPQPEFHANEVNATVNAFALAPYYADPPFGPDDEAVLDGWLDPSNPSYNLPRRVVFPAVAADVVAAVAFAKEHGVKVSVKNSGHSYAGSSTARDSLLVNMNRYERYALASDDEGIGADEVGVEECAAATTTDDEGTTTLEGQPCRLARARGKPAVLRVGGGENFDKAYRAVKVFNEKNGDGYKYHMVGGAAGTVSPMGWTWMGGLAATTMGRTLGFGVDQVLQIEAVLPNGHHVRFGPTEWEDSEGYLVPKTTKVSGECMIDEEWSECPAEDDINFDDLWFAMRGGGGGTWGVVLSTHLQLHPYLPHERVVPGEACTGSRDVVALMAAFALDFFLDPGALGASEALSNACGLANGYHVGRFDCFGDGVGQPIVDLWRGFVASDGRSESLEAAGMTADDIEAASNCLEVQTYNDYGETGIFTEGPYAGKVQDTGKPTYISDLYGSLNQLIPKEWMLNNKEAMIAWLTDNPSGGYFAFGGDSDRVHDQTSSLSRGHREAGTLIIYNILTNDNEQLLDQYDFTGETIPSYVGANHVGPNSYGPMKGDKTQPCPVWFLTNAEAEELCVPILEAVYGTETLARLESIKKAIDPDTMFDCYRCVGNKSPSGGGGEPDPDAGAAVGTGAPSASPADVADSNAPTSPPQVEPDTDAGTEEGDESSTGMRNIALAPTSALTVAIAIAGLF